MRSEQLGHEAVSSPSSSSSCDPREGGRAKRGSVGERRRKQRAQASERRLRRGPSPHTRHTCRRGSHQGDEEPVPARAGVVERPGCLVEIEVRELHVVVHSRAHGRRAETWREPCAVRRRGAPGAGLPRGCESRRRESVRASANSLSPGGGSVGAAALSARGNGRRRGIVVAAGALPVEARSSRRCNATEAPLAPAPGAACAGLRWQAPGSMPGVPVRLARSAGGASARGLLDPGGGIALLRRSPLPHPDGCLTGAVSPARKSWARLDEPIRLRLFQ